MHEYKVTWPKQSIPWYVMANSTDHARRILISMLPDHLNRVITIELAF